MAQYRDESSSARSQVVLTLADGTVMTAGVRLGLSNRLGDMLNGPEQFLDVVGLDGTQQFISKAMVRAVRSAVLPRADQLEIDQRAAAGFDPYALLKVQKGASKDEIRTAYHHMARLYHPDRLASQGLPSEVLDYVRAMLVRINLAYEQIGK